MSTALFPFNHNDLIIYFFHTIPFFLTIVVVMVWRGWGQTGGSKPPAFRSLHSRFLPFFPYLPHLSPFLIAKYWPFPSISPTSQPFRTHTFCPFLLCLLFFWVPPPPIFFPHNVSSSSRGGGEGRMGKAVWSTLGGPLAMPLLILSQNCTLHVPLIFFWH